MDSQPWRQPLEQLAGFTDLSAQPQAQLHAGDFSLAAIERLLDALGRPERSYAVLHVAGTNGKGSVAALCAAALQAQGYRVGLFTSPHLAGHFAGVQLDGQAIPPQQASAQLAAMQTAIEQQPSLTQFEIVTALALRYFAEHQVDIAVVEAGLGGRLDATNVVLPAVSVISSIDLEHRSILGNSLAAIAGHKAGIIKAGVPVVIAPQAGEARQVLVEAAEPQQAPVIEIGRDVLFEVLASEPTGQAIAIWRAGAEGARFEARLGLLGAHQAQNAALAYAALKALEPAGLHVTDSAIRKGFAQARWPGRFEVLRAEPPIVLDAAHTPAAARALRAALDDYFPEMQLVLLIGVSGDKDVQELLGPLAERVVAVIATQSSHARAMPARELAQRLSDVAVQAEAIPNAGAALERALEQAGTDRLLLACGSVFLVEQVRAEWLARD